MRERLEQLRASLTDQLRAIDAEAERVGCAPEQLRDRVGGFTAAPVLVALANVECVLTDFREVTQMSEPVRYCCQAISDAGFVCTLDKNHTESHAAQTVQGLVVDRWAR